MDIVINRIEIANEEDIAYARQRSRLIAELLGFARNDQARIGTAVSEIARNAFQHARGGEVIFSVKNKPPAQLLAIKVCDQGPGIKEAEAILEGCYKSTTGMGQGIVGTRRLMDHFHLETQIEVGTKVFFAKNLPPNTPEITHLTINEITKELAKARSNSPLEEIRLQNKELLKTMNELQESEEKYRQIVDNISDVVWITDLNFNLTYVSPSVEKLVGESVEIHLKKPVEERFTPESLNTISAMIREELEKDSTSDTNESKMIEVKHFRVDGSVMWVSMHVSTIRDQSGNVIGFQGSTRDVTERKQAEQKLADYALELEELYRYLDQEISKAQQVHEQVLPKSLPSIGNISFAAYYQPAEKMGGDFYDVIHRGNKLIFYLSDVSGHGLDGAMLSFFVKHTINSYIDLTPAETITPQTVLNYLAEKFYQETFPEELYIAIFLSVLDLETLELTYSGAGFQEKPLVRLGTDEQLKLASKGLFISPLFPVDALNFDEDSVKLSPGSTLFFTTDGLTEQTSNGTHFMDRLPDVFYANAHLPPELIKQAVVEDFRQFNNGSLQGKDDITFLVIKVEGE